MPVTIAQVVAKQSELAGFIGRAYSNLTKIEVKKRVPIHGRTRVEALEANWRKFQDNHEQLNTLKSDEKRELAYFKDDAYSACEESYLDNKSEMLILIENWQPPAAVAPGQLDAPINAPAGASGPRSRQLPRIDLPSFSGVYSEWTQFRDLFTSMVNANNELSCVEKLQYLKMSLKGEAAALLRNIQVTGENFARAWEALVSRYENKRVLIDTHLAALFSVRRLTTESAADLKQLLGDVKDALGALAVLGSPVQHWDHVLVYLVARNLDPESLKDWEKKIGADTDPAQFEDLENFLLGRVRALEGVERVSASREPRVIASAGTAAGSKPRSAKALQMSVAPDESTSAAERQKNTCALCSAAHFVAACPTWRSKTPEERREIVTQKKLCYNCLGPHQFRNCRSKKRCQQCQNPHHTSIHRLNPPGNREPVAAATARLPTAAVPPPAVLAPSQPSTSAPTIASRPGTSASINVSVSRTTRHAPAMLATALVNIVSGYGEPIEARALLDQGSEISCITESFAQRLNLPRRRVMLPIQGIGGQKPSVARVSLSLELFSRVKPSFSCRVDAYVLAQLVAYLPPIRVLDGVWPHVKGLSLADPDFSSARPIDLVLGSGTYGLLFEEGLRKGPVGSPLAQNTALGWILSGFVDVTDDALNCDRPAHGLQCSVDHQLLELLQRFWVQEETSSRAEHQLTMEESQCEEHFATSHSGSSDGRYIVRLPLKQPPDGLGDSRAIALRTLARQEARFATNAELEREYKKFLYEYEALGHMVPVPDSQPQPRHTFYLPHHAVARETSTTTRVRVVFNGSQRSSSGLSVNDLQHAGPKLQTDLADVITRWRRHAYVFSADVEKMYRQIRVHPDDWDLQRILWRGEKTDPVKAYKLCTVTYGLTSAPYLAIRTLRQLAIDEGQRFPLAVDVINRETYVDDVLSGADALDAAREKVRHVIGILNAGGFSLQKWTANNEDVLSDVPDQKKETGSALSLANDPLFRALGLSWQSRSDTFVFTSRSHETSQRPSKRTVLSRVAQLFDPLGWVAPVVIRAKIFMQELWACGLEWDDSLPAELASRWEKFERELDGVSAIAVPRWIGYDSSAAAMELHGFSDASQAALGAVVYLRVMTDLDDVRVSLVSAKSKVAPLKKVTIPRLELSAAVLLVRQISHVRKVLDLEAAPVHLWTDSTVVLAYIKSHPGRWADYVRNRVTEIQELPNSRWHHVSGRENPADHASRGLSPQQLAEETLWWTGPSWLSKHSTAWPSSIPALDGDAVLEVRAKAATAAASGSTDGLWELLERYSRLTTLLRITAWCTRAVRRFKRLAVSSPASSPLSTAELDDARFMWIKKIQEAEFGPEMQHLLDGKQLARSSPLSRLIPFVDGSGLLRVGGRLRHALLDPDERHPIILPRESALTSLIISHYHRVTLHGGTQVTLATLRRRYWIVGGRVPVRSFIRCCLPCVRQRAAMSQQLMGQLPSSRVNRARPFEHTGVDYAGPIALKTFRGRGAKTYKGYIIVFVCMSSSAIHLEVATDFSTEGFIAAYKRFTGRRGICKTLASDCGTNLVGADAELRKLFHAASRESTVIANLLANDGTQWKFNPPSAPHFGGKWEAGVKSVKFHLKRVIGDTKLTYEEFATFLAQVEAVLNSRPLCPLLDDPSDLAALTPGHFIIGTAMNAVPEPSLTDLPTSRLSRWQLLRQMLEHFWHRWSLEYLQRLQTVAKWQRAQPSLTVGSLVLVKDERYPPSKWPLGRIIDVYPGQDGLVRVATVKTASTTLKRPVVKLCALPIPSDDDTV